MSVGRPLGRASSDKVGRDQFADSHKAVLTGLGRLADLVHTPAHEEVAATLADVAGQLSLHLAAEDEILLPKFRAVNPSEAALLAAEHDALRRLLETAKAEARIQVLRVETVEALSAGLRAHAEREERTLYRWAESRLLPWLWSQAARRLPPRSLRGERELEGQTVARAPGTASVTLAKSTT